MDPSSAAMPAPARAASRMPVKTGASSMASETPTSPPTLASWRKLARADRVDSAATPPEKKPTMAMSGSEPTPTDCIWRRVRLPRQGRPKTPDTACESRLARLPTQASG